MKNTDVLLKGVLFLIMISLTFSTAICGDDEDIAYKSEGDWLSGNGNSCDWSDSGWNWNNH